MSEQVDKVSHASLNGIYVKAQEMDRGQNDDEAAPRFVPPGAVVDASTHASTHASDGDSHESDAQTHASDGDPKAADAETHASDGAVCSYDVQTHASDAPEDSPYDFAH